MALNKTKAMLSICIPIYNFDVTTLIDKLSQQIKKTDVLCEIILIDDCSAEEFKKINENVCRKEIYIQLDKNISRSKVRNLFLKYAKYDYLLFLDCDTFIISDDFVAEYVSTICRKENDVICGGVIYDSYPPERSKRLRWKYGIKKESKPLNIRVLSPNKSFMTSNFIINRRIFEQTKFDERITEYGHEDTLFGFMLKKNGINIKHIDNPVLHGDIDYNTGYLRKTEKGILNLIHILSYVDYDHQFIQDVTILKSYKNLSSKKLTGFINILFICFKPLLKFMIIKGYVNLMLFDFYKLGILIQNYKPQTKAIVH